MPASRLDHLSYSAVCSFLRNRWEFKKRYLDRIYDDTDSPATLVGKSFHRCLELYYSGIPLEQCRESALHYLESRSYLVNWGKTGSLDKAIQEFSQTVDHYFSEDHGYVGRYETERAFTVESRGWKTKVKAVTDLIVHKEDGSYYLVDYKKVQTLSEDKTELRADGSGQMQLVTVQDVKPEYWIQATFNAVCCKETFGSWPTHMIFHQTKTSKNKDGGPQNKKLVVDFSSKETQETMKRVRGMVNQIVREVNKKSTVYLPNISDMFSGSDSFEEFVRA